MLVLEEIREKDIHVCFYLKMVYKIT